MKKTCLLFLILISNFTFSQTYSDSFLGKYDKMADLFNHRKDEEAKKIADELLSGKYGEIDPFSKFFTLFSVANYYYQKDDYQKAYDFYQQFLDFNKNENPKKIDNKKIYIDEAKGKLEELKPKLSLVSSTTTNNAEVTDAAKDELSKTSETKSENLNIASENSAIQAVKKETNTDKTITLTVSGTGKTLEDARLNALRSAIEQAFGAFISSKTEILNDNLVKDEIVSIASGNVQKYDVVSQVELPNTGYALTLSATVSIDKLTSFAQSKGVTVEFKGNMFGATIKLRKLNQESEYIAVKNLLEQSLMILESTYDYSLKVNDPKIINGEDYSVLLEVSATENENYLKFWDFFKKTLKQISLKTEDVGAIKNTGEKVWYVMIDNNRYTLRNRKSLNAFFNFSMMTSLLATNTFFIKNNLGLVKIDNKRGNIFDASIGKYYPENYNYDGYVGKYDKWIISKLEQIFVTYPESELNFINYVKKNKLNIDDLLNSTIIAKEYNYIFLDDVDNSIKILTPFSFPNYGENKNLQYSIKYNLSDIEKIESFQIEKKSLQEILSNNELYRNTKERETFGCFLKGTKIRTPNGAILIENIKPGDVVICFDDKGNLHNSVVESINSHEKQDVYKYSIWNGDAIYATPNHWVLTSENSFSEIGKLNEMITLVDTNGGLKPITKVEYQGQEKVYNFIVKDFHTYIANDIRVHNGGKGKFKLK